MGLREFLFGSRERVTEEHREKPYSVGFPTSYPSRQFDESKLDVWGRLHMRNPSKHPSYANVRCDSNRCGVCGRFVLGRVDWDETVNGAGQHLCPECFAEYCKWLKTKTDTILDDVESEFGWYDGFEANARLTYWTLRQAFAVDVQDGLISEALARQELKVEEEKIREIGNELVRDYKMRMYEQQQAQRAACDASNIANRLS